MTRVSQRTFPNYMKQKYRDYNGEAWMFIRDIPLGIVPYRSTREASFKVQLNEPDTDLEKRLCKLLHIEHEEHNLIDAYLTFVHDITPYIARFGEVYFEIIKIDDNTRLEIIPLGPIVKINKYFVQIIPYQDWKENKRKVIPIGSENVWHMKLPKRLGSPKSHRKLLDNIQRLSEPTPKFFFEDGQLGKSVEYDFMHHRQLKEVVRESLTRTWGTIPSLRQLNGTTEYYYIMHSLRFKYSQALIREHITQEINNLMKRLDMNNSIEVIGLPTSQDVLNAIDSLEKGDIGFSEALNATKTP